MTSEVRHADLSTLRINRNSQPENSGGTSRVKILVMVLVLVVLGGGGWYVYSEYLSGGEEVDIGIATLSSPSQANSVLTASGYVVAERKASVSSRITGRLTSLYVIEGDNVKDGQIIGRIESADIEATLAQLKASLRMAKADMDNAQVEVEDAKIQLDRQTTLYDKRSVPLVDLDAAKVRYNRALAQLSAREAGVAVAEANIRAAQVQLENTYIRAPFDGTVLNKNANVGEVITSLGAAAGSRGAVATIADMTSLEVEADVSESNIERIEPAQPCEVTLDAFPEKRYRSYVHKIIPTADRAKATVLVKIRFAERDERVLPEMSAKVLFLKPGSEQAADDAPPKLLIPGSALVTQNGVTAVFRYDGERVRKTPVTTGETNGTSVEVKQGLSAGDRVVLNPSASLRDGAAVSLKQ